MCRNPATDGPNLIFDQFVGPIKSTTSVPNIGILLIYTHYYDKMCHFFGVNWMLNGCIHLSVFFLDESIR